MITQTKTRITIVEDEEDIREILEYTLRREGFEVACAADGSTGLGMIRRDPPDLVLLDLMLPDVEGLEICRQLKADPNTRGVAIIMVTAKGEESDIVLGLGLGADDYIPKPFSARELVARTRSVLRRVKQPEEELEDNAVLQRGRLHIDPARHKVSVDGEKIDLTATEFKILQLLARHPGRIFSRSQILSESRGELAAAFDRSVDAHVRTIRKKLGPLRDMIETVRAVGYRFTEEPETPPGGGGRGARDSMGFFGKIFSRAVLLVLLTAAVVYFASLHALRENVYAETGTRVQQESALVASYAALEWHDGAPTLNAAQLHRVAELLGGSRLTVIGGDGVVLFDSHGDPAAMENHLHRPEVETPGEPVTRLSATLDEEMTYCATPVTRDGRVLAFVRVAQSTQKTNAQLEALNSAAQGSVLVAVLLALVLAVLSARQISRPLRQIGEFVAEVGEGRTGRRIPILPGPEIGQLARTVNAMTDALEEKIARIERDKVEREAILSAIADGLVAVSLENRILFVNGPARRMLRTPAGRVKGLSIGEVTGNPRLLELLRQSASGEEPLVEETVLPGSEGERRIALSAVPLPGEQGHRRGTVLVLRDVTELRHLEEVRRDFVSNVSHELKTPLTAMRGYVDAVLDDGAMESDQRTTFLRKARQNTERLTAIVSDLLSLSRLESQERELSFEALEVRDVIEEVLRETQDLALSRQVSLASELEPGSILVHADAQALHMAISNLVSNAVQYSPAETGRVVVRLATSGDEVRIDVVDNGPGIPRSEHERIFERFYRVDKARSRRLGGTGLGLSIVRHVMAAHDGRVELDSAPGKGSRFRLVLQRARDAARGAAEPAAE